MTDTNIYSLDYGFSNPERQFDIALGIASSRWRLKKRDVKCKPFTKTIRSNFSDAIYMGVLTVAGLLMAALLADEGLLWVTSGCALAAILILMGAMTSRRTYRKTWMQFSQQGRYGGELVFDEVGIQQKSVSGIEIKVLWNDYDSCFITDEVIVILMKPAMMFLLDNTHETQRTIQYALEHFGYGNTIYKRKVKK